MLLMMKIILQQQLKKKKLKKMKKFLERFRYEFFSINVGSAEYLGTGSSIRKGSTDIQVMGTAYKIYACGIMVEAGAMERIQKHKF